MNLVNRAGRLQKKMDEVAESLEQKQRAENQKTIFEVVQSEEEKEQVVKKYEKIDEKNNEPINLILVRCY